MEHDEQHTHVRGLAEVRGDDRDVRGGGDRGRHRQHPALPLTTLASRNG